MSFFENFLYVLKGGISVAIFRAILAVSIHACLGIVMGRFFMLAKLENKKNTLWLSLLIPVIIHGIYDYSLVSKFLILKLLVIVFVVILFKMSFKTVKFYSKISNKK